MLCHRKNRLSISLWNWVLWECPSHFHPISWNSWRRCLLVQKIKVLHSLRQQRLSVNWNRYPNWMCHILCLGLMRKETPVAGWVTVCNAKLSISYIALLNVSICLMTVVSSRIGIICRQVITSALWLRKIVVWAWIGVFMNLRMMLLPTIWMSWVILSNG